MPGRISLIVFLLLFVSCSNASLEELETRIHNMKRTVQHQNDRIKQLEHTVASQTVEIKELNGELVDVKSENLDKLEHISILKKMILESFRQQSKQEVDPEVHDHLVNFDKNKRLLLDGIKPSPTYVQTTAFYAYMSGALTTQDPDRVLIFNVVKTNINNAYSPHNGIFTVPFDGVYGFTFSVREDGSSYGSYEIMKGTEAVGSAIGIVEGTNIQQQVIGTVIISAKKVKNFR
ncbi:C1QL [Mytilus edulis]|uniref:C1QL n=1 Tax=Mytilus edulis TaxID=6550 RepID=A0A8S3STV5_MYTED|nr:C1QL [Mytilus edulis]